MGRGFRIRMLRKNWARSYSSVAHPRLGEEMMDGMMS
jgi:hypothetical protein